MTNAWCFFSSGSNVLNAMAGVAVTRSTRDDGVNEGAKPCPGSDFRCSSPPGVEKPPSGLNAGIGGVSG